MNKISDTITSLFHIAIKDNSPLVCLSSDGDIVWSDTFGLGWRLGISYNPQATWFTLAKVRLYLDHAHIQSEQDVAVVTVSLKDTLDKDAKTVKERETTITDFGHRQPALLGSWSPSDLALHPYVLLTLTTKARPPLPVIHPLSSTALALRRSAESGDFVNTKFYVFSAKRKGSAAGKPRTVYANSSCIGVALPKTTSGTKRTSGTAPAFLVNMTSDHHINKDSVLHEYEYEQDSDLDEDDEEDTPAVQRSGSSQSRPSHKPHISTSSTAGSRTNDEFSEEPPAYSVSNCRMILVKGVAYKTWLSYIYFRYTGRVSFQPLKSASGRSDTVTNDFSQLPTCSPKSMYRLAASLGDERMKELAFRAIQEGLTKDNIVDEAFSWFTSQYTAISEYEVEKVFEFRKLPEVSLALRLQFKAVSLGEKPWADNVLIAIMDKLNPSESSST